VQKKSLNRDKPSKTTENPPKDSQSNKYEKEAVVLPFLLRKPVSLRYKQAMKVLVFQNGNISSIIKDSFLAYFFSNLYFLTYCEDLINP